MSTNGLNGPSYPIVVEPSDGEGLTIEMLVSAFYMYTPQFHWTVTMGAEYRPTCSIAQNIAHE